MILEIVVNGWGAFCDQSDESFKSLSVNRYCINMVHALCKESWLVVFYGISTIVGYLMPHPFLYQLILFQTIQFSLSTQFIKNISISSYSV